MILRILNEIKVEIIGIILNLLIKHIRMLRQIHSRPTNNESGDNEMHIKINEQLKQSNRHLRFFLVVE